LRFEGGLEAIDEVSEGEGEDGMVEICGLLELLFGELFRNC